MRDGLWLPLRIDVALWCNWLTRRPLKAKSSGSSPDIATKKFLIITELSLSIQRTQQTVRGRVLFSVVIGAVLCSGMHLELWC